MLAPGHFLKRNVARTQLLMQPLSPEVDLTTHSCSDSDKDRTGVVGGIRGGARPTLHFPNSKYREKSVAGRFLLPCKQGFVLLLNFHLPNSPSFIGQSAERKRSRVDGRGERGLKTPPLLPLLQLSLMAKTLSLLTGGDSHPCLCSPLPSIFLAQKPSE